MGRRPTSRTKRRKNERSALARVAAPRPFLALFRRRKGLAALKRRPVPFAAPPPPASAPFANPAEIPAFSRAAIDSRFALEAKKVPVEVAAAVRSRVRLAPALLVNAVVLFLALDFAGSLYLREALGVKLLDEYRANLVPPSQSVVSDTAGVRVGALATAEAVREPIDEVPRVFKDALVRWEDARFAAHDGVDRYRILGAFAALMHGDPQGGSTITMQLAKLIKRDSARTLRRKLEDIALALALDDRLGKDAVLHLYANHAYFGSGVYGIGQACKFYFERNQCEGLTLVEAAYLVSLLRAPADLARDEGRALARRNAVLEQMREPRPPPTSAKTWDRLTRYAWIAIHRFFDHRVAGRSDLEGRYSDAEIDRAKKQPLNLARHQEPPTHPFVLETARQELQKRLGPAIYEDGLDVRLTIDADVQKAAETALTEGLRNLRKLQGRPEDDKDDLDGGVVVVDPKTGHLLAYVPGADFAHSQVPFAARPIQVGSSLKPFVYSELFEQGKGDLQSLVLDGPICIGGWCPKNYDKKYHGNVTVQFALSHSLNTAAVRVADKVGVDAITARLRLLGVQSQLTANLPMALGASELTLLELGGLYASLYDGHVVRPKLVLDVKDRAGNVIYGGDDPVRPVAYKPSTITQLHTAMAGVVQPGGTAGMMGRDLEEYFGLPANQHLGEVPGVSPQLACKTGTHDGFTRVGLGCVVSDTDIGPVAIVTYVGYRTPKPLGNGFTGGHVAGPIVESIIKALTARTKVAGAFRPFPDRPLDAPIIADAEAPAPPPTEAAAPTSPLADAVSRRISGDSAKGNFALGRASLAAPEPEPPLLPLELAPVAATETGLPVADENASLPRLAAPHDWPGLRVLDTDVVEASGPALVKDFLDHGGREEELTELAPMLDLTIDRRVVHQHRLLGPGFSDRTMSQRLVLLSQRVTGSLQRMIDQRQAYTEFLQPDPQTEIIADVDSDRRIERSYHFAQAIRAMRVTRHHTSGQLLALEFVTADGERHALVRRGERLAQLSTRQVKVTKGSLEQAWLSAGMSPAQLDGLRALLGTKVNIDRIPRGFELDLLLADGSLIGVESALPNRYGTEVDRAGAVRIEGSCVADDGVPCARRLLPLPLAEARVYNHRGAGTHGEVLVQRDASGTVAVAPVDAKVLFSLPERDLVVLAEDDGTIFRLEGVKPVVASDDVVRAGAPLGRVDPRGAVVFRALSDEGNGFAEPIDALESLPELGGADEELRGVANWWRDLHGWLRGEGPELRRSLVVQPS